ncbi:MAG: LPS assembly lipoprotein LptE [Helicobacter sp.]|nr:LPS assembly lipoprotein LptE [Helicobacter sp.]
MKVALVIFSLLLSACGYAPLSSYAKNALGDRVHVILDINAQNISDLESSVELKDLLNESLLSRLQLQVVDEKEATSTLRVKIIQISDSSIATNDSGLSTFYRAQVGLSFSYKTKDGLERIFNNSSYFDYPVNIQNPLITYKNRKNAIYEAMSQSVDKFLSQIAFTKAPQEAQL